MPTGRTRSIALLFACACRPAAPRPVADPVPAVAEPVREVSKPAPPAKASYPRVVLRAISGDDYAGLALAELQTEGVVAWALFTPSGDDLYVYPLVFSDRRTGTEAIDATECRRYAEFMRSAAVETMAPFRFDPAGCDREARDIVQIDVAPPTEPSWLSFVEIPGGDPPGFYPSYTSYGLDVEVWVWRMFPLEPGEPQEPSQPAGFKIDALTFGVGIPIVLPDR